MEHSDLEEQCKHLTIVQTNGGNSFCEYRCSYDKDCVHRHNYYGNGYCKKELTFERPWIISVRKDF